MKFKFRISNLIIHKSGHKIVKVVGKSINIGKTTNPNGYHLQLIWDRDFPEFNNSPWSYFKPKEVCEKYFKKLSKLEKVMRGIK